MTLSQPRYVKTGGDPRALAEYAALRQEMQKLTHPARPDVDWPQVSRLCLTLFEQNGVELQSAVWYTLSRAHSAGSAGMAEGLAVLTALLTREWPTLWPRPAHTRIELLAGLSRRLQQFLRTQTLTEADLTALSQAARLLSEVGDHLQRLELRQLSQIDALLDRIRSAVVMLERCDAPQHVGVAEEAADEPPTTLPADTHSRPWVYVQAAHADRPKPERARWPMFVAGAASTLLLGAMIAAVVSFTQPPPLEHQLLTSLAALPKLLKPESVAALEANPPQWLSDAEWLKQMQQQLDVLLNASPSVLLEHGNALVEQMNALLPESENAAAITAKWNKQLQAAAMPAEMRDGWQQGMEQLYALSQRLDQLDEKRGKYLTVSELKTAVFGMQKAFNTAIPLEEQLRQLQEQRNRGQALNQAQRIQLEMHLKQLTAQYMLLVSSFGK
jgi:type VI secretion system protein VasL